MKELLQKKKVLISDGAMGTELMKRGLHSGECPELWNIDKPERVLELSIKYVEAGSDIILTNTFGGSRLKLRKFKLENKVAELNREGVKIARNASYGKDILVFASVGPTGEFMEPVGTITEQEMNNVFTEQLEALIHAGADGIVIETMMSIEEALCALRAAKKITHIPVVVSMTYNQNEQGFVTMMGITPAKAVEELLKNRVDILGANCGVGPKSMIELTKILHSLTNLPLWIKPNAGMPELVNGKTVYRETPEEMSHSILEIINAGADIVGGCCGTTPEHIRLISNIRDKKLSI